jgi:diguanylate cyclase (GGDEF)-like protein
VPGPQQTKRAISWVFDVAVMTSGALIGLVALVALLVGPHLTGQWVLALALGPLVIALMSRFPLVLDRSSSGVEVGFESAVLVFLACIGGGHGALAVWAVGQVLSQATTAKRPDVRLFNIGVSTLSGCAALLTMRAMSPLDSTDPRELLAVGAGCAVYFLVDYVVSAMSIALESAEPVLAELRQASALVALGVFVAIDSLGYLAALVNRSLEPWAGALLAVPVLTILVATRALSRGSEHRRRLEALFGAAAEAQVVHTRTSLEDLLRRQVRAVVATGRADLRRDGPSSREIGARVRTGEGTWWLVAPAIDRARASVEADQKALEALATVAEEAFGRLALTDEMGHLARHDALTALPNRTLFLDRVEQAVFRSRRSGTSIAVLFLDLDGFKGVNDRFGHAEGDELLKAVAARLVACVRAEDSVARLGGDEFAVLFLDLDGFKGVNDRFGHAEGDELLKAVAARLVACVRAEDSVARLGGDEFAVLVEGVDDVAELDVLCHRLLGSLRREVVIHGHEVVVGASIGVAVADADDDAAGLLRNADMAMYRAKALGKDRFFVYQPSLREENVRRLELVEALRREMATQLVVHYQPIVNLETGVVDGLEALVRWQREEGLLAPDIFIAAAEESGLIVELGERVLQRVVADSAILEAAAGRPLSLGVNMSAHQLRDATFLDLVATAVTALGDNNLVLEMTETVVVTHDDETDAALRRLTAVGARLAIDDFGVGFSSIGYLQHLPVDILKIDRSFTRDVDSSPRAAALVEAILVMGAALDLRVVAEGIERPSQAARLRDAGCVVGQGFLYGRPVPLVEATRLLRAGTGELTVTGA